MEEKYEVKIRGLRPLLQHRMSNEPVKRKKMGCSYDNQEDAENCLYKDSEGRICQPANHIESALIKASANYRIGGQGKKTYKDAFKGGVFIDPLFIPHLIPDWVIDLQNVVIQRARILRARPRFDKWELNFTITLIDERITPDVLKDVLIDAGKFCGLGDNRPRYGTFEVTAFNKL